MQATTVGTKVLTRVPTQERGDGQRARRVRRLGRRRLRAEVRVLHMHMHTCDRNQVHASLNLLDYATSCSPNCLVPSDKF